MKLGGVFNQRVRGFRVVELGELGVLMVLVLAVYLAKAGGGDERADIDRAQQQIYEEQTRVRLLQAEVATLEQPERLESLSNRYLGLQPVPAKHEVRPEALADLVLRTSKADPVQGAASASAATQATTTPTSSADPPKTAASSGRSER
jgi:cell division protein FtsL